MCDAAGNVYVAGSFQSPTVQVGATHLTRRYYRDMLLARLDGATGQWHWATRAGAPGRLALDGRVHIYVTGSVLREADFGADTLRTYVSGSSCTYAANHQAFVARASASSGAWQWARQWGDSNVSGIYRYGGVGAYGTMVDSRGVITVLGTLRMCQAVQVGSFTLTNNSQTYQELGCGRTQYMDDMFIAQMDSMGNWINAAVYGGAGEEYFNGAVIQPNGTLWVQGLGGYAHPGVGSSFALGALPVQINGLTTMWAQFDPLTNTWTDVVTIPSSLYGPIAVDALGRRYGSSCFTTPTLQLGSVITNGLPSGRTSYLARFGAGPLSVAKDSRASEGLIVWPNPADGKVQVSGAAPGLTLWLLDLQGRRVREERMPASGALALPISGLAAGGYVVRVPATGQVKRLVVE